MAFKKKIALLALLACSAPVWALKVQHLSPQGTVDEARQVIVRTDQDAVRLGDAQAAAPVRVRCNPAQAAAGAGRWNSAREWVWQFARPVPAGALCQVQLEKSFKSPGNVGISGAVSYSFEVAGPRVLQSWPDGYATIEEEQVFVLHLNAPATRDSLLQHSHCRSPVPQSYDSQAFFE